MDMTITVPPTLVQSKREKGPQVQRQSKRKYNPRTKFEAFVFEKDFNGHVLSQVSGVAQPALQAVMAGQKKISNMSMRTGLKLSKALEITMEELLDLDE